MQKRVTYVLSGWIRLHIIEKQAGTKKWSFFRFGRRTVLSAISKVADLMRALAIKGIFSNMSSHLAADTAH